MTFILRLRSSTVATALFVAALVGMGVFATIDPTTAEIPGTFMMVFGYLVAATLFTRRSWALDRGDGRAWRWIAVALYCGAVGVLVLALLSAMGYDAPAFGPVDLLFLSGYAAMIVCLTMLTRRGVQGTGWVVTLVDTAVGAISLATFVWLGIGRSLVAAMANADLTARIIAPIYPVLDTAIIVGLMAMSVRRTAFRLDPKLILLSIGVCIQVVADFLFLVEGVGESFGDTAPRIDLFLFASACYVGVAMLLTPSSRPREFPDRHVSTVALFWPYLLGVGVVVMHIVGLLRLGIDTDELVTLLGALAVGFLVLVRQAIAIRHAQRRVEQQRLELISSVSHEIRTPLTGLIGYLELLTQAGDDLDPDESREMLHVASGEAAQLGRIITDMIAMARDDGRGLPVTGSTTRLAEICDAAIDGAAVPGVTMSVEDGGEIEADRNRLAQALMNLITNAAKYGKGRIHVVGLRAGDQIELSVHDDGPGVPIRFQERIFEKFERGAHRFDATTPGMGVGLAIVRAIAQAHGGSTHYRRSELLGGACFTVKVPVMAARTTAAPAPVPVQSLAS